MKDAQEVARALKEMGWEVDLLEDPDGDQLDLSLTSLITGQGRRDDLAMLIWFSGHGHTLQEADGTKLGYIVPVDAPRPSRDEVGFMRKAIDSAVEGVTAVLEDFLQVPGSAGSLPPAIRQVHRAPPPKHLPRDVGPGGA